MTFNYLCIEFVALPRKYLLKWQERTRIPKTGDKSVIACWVQNK